jgi:hypothetical protein
MSDRVHFEFRAAPSSSSVEGILLHFLRSGEERYPLSKNELVMKALKLCWLPFALRESGLKTKGELKKIASATIYNLEWHIREIRLEFGLAVCPPPATSEALVRDDAEDAEDVEDTSSITIGFG